MKKLELNQMEVVDGGQDTGDLSCGEYYTGISVAIGGSAFYITALFGPIGAIGSFIAATAVSLYALSACDDQ